MKALCIIAQAHGSDTPGKCSPDKSFYEWQWSREFTKMLIKGLDEIGVDSVIINPSEKEVGLVTQANNVNKMYASERGTYDEIFLLSPHVNAGNEFRWSSSSGFTAWVGTKAGKKSKRLGTIFGEIAEEMKLTGNRYIPRDKYWVGNFTILNRTNCPAVLTENMFQTNKKDVEFLKSDEGKKKLLDLHIEAVKRYLEEL